eukprot:tig00001408_g8616.t1
MSFFVTQRERVGYRDYDRIPNDQVVPLPPLVDLGEQQTSQSTLLLQKKKEMAEVQEELDRKKEEFKERMRRCQAKEEELAKKQQQIREQVIKFEKFLKENDAKRMRAHRKAAEEIKLREAKELEIIELEESLRELIHNKEQMARMLEKMMKYQRYLESVVQHAADEFPEVQDVLARYATLSGANTDLTAGVQRDMDTMEQQRAKLANFIKEKQNTLLVSNSEIAELQMKLEARKAEVARFDQQALLKESDANNRNRLLGEIKMSIMNVYGRCQFRQPLEGDASLVAYLEQIKQRLLDMQDICENRARFKMPPARPRPRPPAPRPPASSCPLTARRAGRRLRRGSGRAGGRRAARRARGPGAQPRAPGATKKAKAPASAKELGSSLDSDGLSFLKESPRIS